MRRAKALGVVFAYEGPQPTSEASDKKLTSGTGEERKILLHAAGSLESTREDTLDREGTRRPETDLSIYIPWPFPPVWGVADNTIRNKQKQWGFHTVLPAMTRDPAEVWMALLEQHNPSSPVFHNLRRFIDAVSPTAPTTGLPLQGNPVATADANQNCVTIIPIPTCLPYIHPPIIQGSFYSIHPPKPRPPSSTSPINFLHSLPFSAVIHYPSSPHDRTISKHSYPL